MVDKYLNLRFINLPICLSPNQPIENKIKGKCTIGRLKAIGQSTDRKTISRSTDHPISQSNTINQSDKQDNLLIDQSTDLTIKFKKNLPIKIKNKIKKCSAITMAECSGYELKDIIIYVGKKCKKR